MAQAKRIRLADGTVYLVTPKGWRRDSPRRWEAKDRKGLHNRSAKRRHYAVVFG